jgi:hypothetical protein
MEVLELKNAVTESTFTMYGFNSDSDTDKEKIS